MAKVNSRFLFSTAQWSHRCWPNCANTLTKTKNHHPLFKKASKFLGHFVKSSKLAFFMTLGQILRLWPLCPLHQSKGRIAWVENLWWMLSPLQKCVVKLMTSKSQTQRESMGKAKPRNFLCYISVVKRSNLTSFIWLMCKLANEKIIKAGLICKHKYKNGRFCLLLFSLMYLYNKVSTPLSTWKLFHWKNFISKH